MHGGREGEDGMFMNECIDSTMGRIPVCLLCCLLVTIRGLVGSFTTTTLSIDSAFTIRFFFFLISIS